MREYIKVSLPDSQSLKEKELQKYLGQEVGIEINKRKYATGILKQGVRKYFIKSFEGKKIEIKIGDLESVLIRKKFHSKDNSQT